MRLVKYSVLVLALQFALFGLVEAKKGGSSKPKLTVTSTDFTNKGMIPADNACDAFDFEDDGVSPELSWTGVPEGTESFALIMNDKSFRNLTHWLAYNIPGTETGIAGGLTNEADLPNGGKMGTNGAKEVSYFGPCPPPKRTHKYVIKVFALDAVLALEDGADKKAVMAEVKKHKLATGKLVGKFKQAQ